MDKSSITSSKRKNPPINPTLFPIIAGAILIVCLVFFFYTLSDIAKSKGEPKVFDINTASTTDTSLLLSWNCTPEAEKYSVRCIDSNGDEITQQTTEIPFAVVRELAPNTKYTVEIAPFKDGTLYPACSASATTDPHCKVTSIDVKNISSHSATISWEYSGESDGFTAVAYAVDIYGKRHLTSQKIEIKKGAANKCTIENLMPHTKYTVTVMPNTKFNEAYNTTFTTQDELVTYDKFNVVRSVICSADTEYAHTVNSLIHIHTSQDYKISTVISGDSSKDHTSDMSLYIKDKNGNLYSETNFGAVHTNPNGYASYIHRVILLSFKSPSIEGEYEAILTIDGEIAAKIDFKASESVN